MTLSIFDVIEKDNNFRQILRNMVEASINESFNGIMITEADEGYSIRHVNPAFCTMTGYTQEEIIGKSPAILQGPLTDKTVLDRLKSDLGLGKSFHGQAINYRKDGSQFLMEWKIAPIRNSERKVTHFMAIQREIT